MMLEAFERHLAAHDIAKRFEKAETKEDRIAVCKKFLEDNDYTVEKVSKVKGAVFSEKDFQPLGVMGANGPSGTLNAPTITGIFSSPKHNVEEIEARISINQEMVIVARDEKMMEAYAMDQLSRQLASKIAQFAEFKSEKQFDTLQTHYRMRVKVLKP